MNDSSFVKQRLTEASRTKDLARVLSLLFATAAGAVFLLLVVALADYWLILPMSVRIGGMLLLGLILALSAFRFSATMRRPTELKEVALDAEARKPEAGCELSTAAEYLKRKPAQEYESELAAALEAKAADHLKTLQVPYWNRPIPSALFLGACGVAVLLFGILASGGLTAFKRAAAPWSNTPYTRVEVQPGNVEVPAGQGLDIKSVFSGRVPRDARFAWQDEGSPKWQFASLTRNASGEYVHPLKNVRTPVSYRVSGSDAVSPEFKVEPYLPPEAKDWSARLELPEYVKRPALVENSPNISVLRGSTATLQMTPNVKLAHARLRFDEGPAVEMKPTENGFWTATLKVSRDAKYWVELADEKGHKGGNEEPFLITALPDEAPRVEIPEPGQDMQAQATNTVPVKISVTDDYGLQEIKLVYHKLGAAEQSVPAKRSGETNSEFVAEIPLSSLGLEEFELVAYHAEATDNNTLDGPGVGRSDVYFIEISNQEGGKSKSQGKSQRVNLLVIQKQIIADTTALAAKASPEKFDELAKRQKDAAEFGNIYTKALGAKGSGEALTEMQLAVADMQKAQGALEKQLRSETLPPAESALAHLYKVVKLMPELKDLPTQPQKMPQEKTNKPPVLNVVLDAMKKNKPEEANNQALEEALEQAEQLRDEQGALNLGVQNSGSGEGKGRGESQLVRASGEARSGEGKSQAKSKASKSKSKESKESKAKAGKNKGPGKPGEGKQGEGKAGEKKEEEAKPNDAPEAQELAQKQDELSKEAAALAEKLVRLAGKDKRLGHNAGGKMWQASKQMNAAAQAMAQGNRQSAGIKGAESGASLNEAIAMIERALNSRPERVDVSQEDSPREYEALIAEYFRKLSHQE